MAIFSSKWEPNGQFPIAEDVHILGGVHVVEDEAERLAIPVLRQKQGMLVYQRNPSPGSWWRLDTVNDGAPVFSQVILFLESGSEFNARGVPHGDRNYSVGTSINNPGNGPITNFYVRGGSAYLRMYAEKGVPQQSLLASSLLQLEAEGSAAYLRIYSNAIFALAATGNNVPVHVRSTSPDKSQLFVDDWNGKGVKIEWDPSTLTATMLPVTGDSKLETRYDLDNADAKIDKMASLFANAFAKGTAADGVQPSQIMWGCQLFPTWTAKILSTVSSVSAAAKVKPGAVAFPNGLMHVISSDLHFEFHINEGITYTTPKETIGGTVPTLPTGTGSIKFLYIFLRKKAGDASAVVRYDVNPPDAYGRPQAVGGNEATAGYTVNDYAFVGTLTVWNALDIVNLYSTPSADIQAEIWKSGAFVQHLGGGLRRFGVASVHNISDNFLNSITHGSTSAGARSRSTLVNSTLYADAGDLAAHCQGAGITYRTTISEGGGAYTQFILQGPGFLITDDIGPNSSKDYCIHADIHFYDSESMKVALENILSSGSSAITSTGYVAINSLLENVNSLHRRAPDANWP